MLPFFSSCEKVLHFQNVGYLESESWTFQIDMSDHSMYPDQRWNNAILTSTSVSPTSCIGLRGISNHLVSARYTNFCRNWSCLSGCVDFFRYRVCFKRELISSLFRSTDIFWRGGGNFWNVKPTKQASQNQCILHLFVKSIADKCLQYHKYTKLEFKKRFL